MPFKMHKKKIQEKRIIKKNMYAYTVLKIFRPFTLTQVFLYLA